LTHGRSGPHPGRGGPLAASFNAPFRSPQRLDDDAVLRQLYPQDQAGAPQELFDHHSEGFFPASLPHAYFSWKIGSARHHLIEGVLQNR